MVVVRARKYQSELKAQRRKKKAYFTSSLRYTPRTALMSRNLCPVFCHLFPSSTANAAPPFPFPSTSSPAPPFPPSTSFPFALPLPFPFPFPFAFAFARPFILPGMIATPCHFLGPAPTVAANNPESSSGLTTSINSGLASRCSFVCVVLRKGTGAAPRVREEGPTGVESERLMEAGSGGRWAGKGMWMWEGCRRRSSMEEEVGAWRRLGGWVVALFEFFSLVLGWRGREETY